MTYLLSIVIFLSSEYCGVMMVIEEVSFAAVAKTRITKIRDGVRMDALVPLVGLRLVA